MENKYPKYVTKRAIEGLVKKIKLPAPDEFSQDWEYEVSDSSKVGEFLYAYKNIELNKEEKFALMMIIIASYNDAILEGKVEKSWASSLGIIFLKILIFIRIVFIIGLCWMRMI
ncbi:hypothetical protein [Lysinibacillus agricola]|uniref:hypothetical protein n=1 Tax=Lysinibacillus agricola TaxID=2590012 RepID=UPI003C203C0F